MSEVDGAIRGLMAFLECNSRKCDGCEYQDKKPGTPGGCRLDQYQVIEDAVRLLREQEQREKRICKAVCSFIRSGISTDTDVDQDYVCYEIQKIFYSFRNGGEADA